MTEQLNCWWSYDFEWCSGNESLCLLYIYPCSLLILGFPGGSAGKESACNVGVLVWIPGLRRSPGEGNGYPLQYSGLENSMDSIVHGITKSQTQLSDFHFTLSKCRLFTKWILEYWSIGFSSKESLCEEVDSLKLLDRFLYHIGEGNGNPLQYSCLENSMGRGAWRAAAHGVAKSWTWLSD